MTRRSAFNLHCWCERLHNTQSFIGLFTSCCQNPFLLNSSSLSCLAPNTSPGLINSQCGCHSLCYLLFIPTDLFSAARRPASRLASPRRACHMETDRGFKSFWSIQFCDGWPACVTTGWACPEQSPGGQTILMPKMRKLPCTITSHLISNLWRQNVSSYHLRVCVCVCVCVCVSGTAVSTLVCIMLVMTDWLKLIINPVCGAKLENDAPFFPSSGVLH